MTPADGGSRRPLVLLLSFGALWLVAAGILSLAASVELHSPRFLEGCPCLSYGRLSAVAETAFVYGWLANAGLAMVLWTLGRLAAEPLRAQRWAVLGTLFWNLGVAAAALGVATGDATGFPLLALPGYVHLILLFSYAAVALPGILAWAGRLRLVAYASQWYGAAALVLFPWILSAAHVVLFSAPARGVVQSVAAAWFAQCAWALWISPMALAVAYYVVPRATGRVLPSYEFASLGFWSLVFLGGLAAGRTLVGGPVPAWIPSVAVVASALLLFHGLIVGLNLRVCVSGAGASLGFIRLGLAAYLLAVLAGAAAPFHALSVRVHFTHAEAALGQLALYGAASGVLLGGIYFAVPRITGRAWLSGGLVRAHLALTVLGVALLVGALAGAGLVQGRLLANPAVAFAEISRATRPWLALASAAQAVLLLGNVAFALNFAGTACRWLDAAEAAEFDAPAGLEAHSP